MHVKCQRSGETLSLDADQQLGGGGEGIIYGLPDKSDLAAKIYHPNKMNAERVSKLEAMLANVPTDPMREKGHASIAWPVELVSSSNGSQEVIGFLMPRLHDARPISDFYDVTTRHERFPLFSYRHLCRTARNLASAVRAIHKSGYVIGDVNELNILVTESALVTIVDTDSFQVTEPAGKRVYRCPVGTEMFTPPELYGKNFEEIDRSQEHDLFGLAVLFFQLLMEGTKPFAGVFRGAGDPPEYVERLLKGYFPYGGHSMSDPPPQAPLFAMLHPRLQKLFRQCFVTGHTDPRQRPDSDTWYQALKEGEDALITCQHNRQHCYFNHCTACPWCERARCFTEAGLPDWDPFPPPERAQEFTNFNYAAAQASARASANARRPAPISRPATVPIGQLPVPSSFFASATTVALGQAVTLQWAIPYAQTIRITDQSGRRLFAGNSPNGSITFYPTTDKTYHLVASGIGVSLPNPVTVAVTQVPQPVTLKQVGLKLHQPTALKAIQVGLLAALSLNRISVKLSAPIKLKRYLPLNSYVKLRRLQLT